MSEYIERGTLIEKRHKVFEYDEAGFCMTYQAVPVEDIQQAPAADVVAVKHGEWVSLTDCANAGVYCSVCHKKVYKEDYAWCNRKNKLRSNYCPTCGAKMDGGADK